MFCLISFVASVLYRGSCTARCDFREVEKHYRRGTFLPSSEGVLDFLQDVRYFEIVQSCTFGIPQAYLSSHRTVESSLDSDGNASWLPFTFSDGVFSNIPAEEGPGRKRVLYNKVISIHVYIIKAPFLVVQFFTLADARHDSTVALGFSQEVQGQQIGHVEDDIEEVWYMSIVRCRSERIPSALDGVKSLHKSLLLPGQASVIEVQQRMEDAIRALLTTTNKRPFGKQKRKTSVQLKKIESRKRLLMRKSW